MPEIRYTLKVEDDEFREVDVFPRTRNATETIEREILAPLNHNREKQAEPLASLVKVEVLNPYVHLHEWRKTHIERSILRARYVCGYCEVTGWKPFHIVNGEQTKGVTRDEAYKNEKWALCRDPLKPAPKKLSFN